jgi:hypothetical protein
VNARTKASVVSNDRVGWHTHCHIRDGWDEWILGPALTAVTLVAAHSLRSNIKGSTDSARCEGIHVASSQS